MRTHLTVVLALTLTLATAGLAQAWTMENADAANTGHLPQATPDDLSDPRETPLSGDAIAQPIQGPANLALVGTLAGSLHAITATGDEAFQTELDGEIRTAPLWTGDTIIVLPRSDTAYALHPDGETAWQIPVENSRPDADVVRMAAPTIHPDGSLLLPTLSGTLHNVHPNGTPDWTHDAGQDRSIQSTPAITSDGTILLASFTPGGGDGLLEALAPDGTLLQSEPLDAQVVGAPALTDDLALIPLRDANTVQARHLDDLASTAYEVSFDYRVTMSPVLHDGLAVAGDASGNLVGFDASTGEIAWSFHPNQDDPEQSPLSGTTATAGQQPLQQPGVPIDVLAVADSPAVDEHGHAWVPYWNVDTTTFPPEDSRESPFYILDIHDEAEIIDRQTYPKAAHGPSLQPTGVWTGTDEGLLRAFPLPENLHIHAHAQGPTVTLLTNTDHRGDWTIDWGSEQLQTGTGSPPALATRELPAGTHEVTVTVADATASTSVTIQEDSPDTGQADDAEAPTTGGGSGEDAIPTPLRAVLIALALAAWGRRRA